MDYYGIPDGGGGPNPSMQCRPISNAACLSDIVDPCACLLQTLKNDPTCFAISCDESLGNPVVHCMVE